MSVTSVAIQFTIVDLLSRGIGNIKNRLHGLASASKEVQKSFDNMTRSFKYAAVAGIATRQIYQGLKPAVNVAGDLQEEMIGVRAELMGAGMDAVQLNNKMKRIKASAFSIQAWTPFDMGGIVALQKALIKSGAMIEDVTAEKGAAAAAAALGTYETIDPVQAGKALIGIGTPFKIAKDQYMSLADKISRASSASTTSAVEIVNAAKYAAMPMAGMKKSSDEMLAFSAVMAQVGIEGSMAGTSIKSFFNMAAKSKKFRDVNGDLLPTLEIIRKLRDMFKDMGTGKRQEILTKMFNERGMPVAIALLNEGKGSYEEVIEAMEDSASLQDKLTLSMSGFNKQLQSLGGTSKSVIADLFQPALKPLTTLIEKVNELVALIGEASQKKESLSKIVSGTSLGALGAGALATTALTGAGLLYLRKVLKGVGGFKGLFKGTGASAAGIAKGKVVEAATGVTPVFVTNWPGYIGGGPPLKKTGAFFSGKSLATIAMLAGKWVAAPLAAGAASYMGMSWLDRKFGLTDYGSTLKNIDEIEAEKQWANQQLQNRINMQVNIDRDDRTTVVTDNMNTQADVKVRKASFK